MTGIVTFRKAIIMLLVLMTGCSFDKPTTPSWDVGVTVPLINKVFTMQEMAEDQSALNIDSTGLVNFEVEAELDEYRVGDQLTLDDVAEEMTLELGSFTIDSPGTEFANVELREIFPQADDLDGQTTVVPPFSFSTDVVLDPYQTYSYVVVETGTIAIDITNNLAVQLGSPMTFEIFDTTSDPWRSVVSHTFTSEILPGASKEFEIDLQGERVPNQLAIRISGESPGSNGDVVTVDASSTFEIAGRIAELIVTEALARIPEQIVQRNETAVIEDSVVIDRADIETGRIEFTITGQLPVDAWLAFELPDFKSASGTTLVDSFFIANNSNFSNSIALQNHSLRPQEADFAEQTVRVIWQIRTIDTGAGMVLIKSSDSFDAQLALRDLQFSSISGKLADTKVDIEQTEVEFDIPTDIDQVFFETARLELFIENGINFPVRTDFRLRGRNEDGETEEIHISEMIQPAMQPGVPVMTTIELTKANSSIEDFINIIPKFFQVDGQVTLGEENWTGTVSKEDMIQAAVRISAPLAVSIPSQSVESEATELDIDEDVREDIIENLSAGSFFITIGNHLPVGASVEFLFGNTSATVFSDPILQVGPIGVGAADTDALGFVQDQMETESNLSLTEEEMQTFLQNPLFAGVRLLVQGTNGESVQVRASDFIQVKSYTKINVKVNQD